MNKKIASLALALVFTAAAVTAAYSFTCEVTAVDGGAVTLKCDSDDAGKLKAGGKVKVKEAKERKAVEGC